MNELTKLCKLANAEAYFDINKLIVVSKDSKKGVGKSIISLSSNSGLIGTPERKGSNLSVRSLLNRGISKNSIIEITYTDLLTGERKPQQYKVISGKHTGSNYSNDFYTECEVKPL